MAKNKGDLNDKQQRFVEEYLIDLNATQAAPGDCVSVPESLGRLVRGISAWTRNWWSTPMNITV